MYLCLQKLLIAIKFSPKDKVMMCAPQTLLRKHHLNELILTPQGIAKRPELTLKSRLSLTMHGDEVKTDEDQKLYVPSPVVSSTDAFRFQSGYVLMSDPDTTQVDVPTNGSAWNHDDDGRL